MKPSVKHALFTTLLFVASLSLGQTHLFAQRTIQGIVVDTTNDPIIGASVLVKGTTHGTVTDLSGSFELEV